MRCETMHSAAAKANIPELQVDENAAASTTSPDVAPWWMQVSAGGHSDGEEPQVRAAWRALPPLLPGEVTELLEIHV